MCGGGSDERLRQAVDRSINPPSSSRNRRNFDSQRISQIMEAAPPSRSMKVVRIALPVPVFREFDYLAPATATD